MTEDKKLKIEFAPGCFDGFEGTQEELDEMMKEIMRLAESGELEAMATPIGCDAFGDDDEADDIVDLINSNTNRKLH